MEFTINCPIDGPVTVSIEDIDTVVLREPERAEISFICPECGTVISVEAIVPAFLLSAMQALAEENDGDVPVARIIALVNEAEEAAGLGGEQGPVVGDPIEPVFEAHDDPRADAYCEYFRRQLDSIECVDDVLAEIDAGKS
ncbi:MAG: hypothetical protein HY876_04790 [Coriobacteriales bacterium]|nr:hypothetical protein [Coriobacteriales bacterium]